MSIHSLVKGMYVWAIEKFLKLNAVIYSPHLLGCLMYF